MQPRFKAVAEAMEPLFQDLLTSNPCSAGTLPSEPEIPKRGVLPVQ
jgi:hypothetical protein